jgi:glycosyltransferase involved in cell wall biosynthesis
MSAGGAVAASAPYAASAAVANSHSLKTGPRRRVALIGHACSPIMGSEPGFTWNWAANLSDQHDVTVFAHPVFRDAVEGELRERPREHLRFVWITLDRFDPWDDNRGERGIRLHYNLWQRKLLKVLRQTLASNTFDLVHHVSWGSLQQPTRAWRVGLPFVWGPLGGGQKWPSAFYELAPSRKSRTFERVRGLLVDAVRINPSVRGAARHADLAIATNRETETLLRKLGARRVELMGDGGVKQQWLRDTPRSAEPGKLTLLAAGRCEARKALPLVLRAMHHIAKTTEVRLLVAGEGPMKDAWRAESASLGLSDCVEFLGQVPWTDMPDVFGRADAFVFPSLRDSTGSVVLEAMGTGLPIITLDHQGVGCLVNDSNGIKVAVTTPGDVVMGLAGAIRKLAMDTELRLRLSTGARQSAEELTWNSRAEKMSLWYEEVLLAHRGV